MTDAPDTIARPKRPGAASAGRDRLIPVAAGVAIVWVLAIGSYAAGFLASAEATPFGGLGALILVLAALAPVGLLGVCVVMLRRTEVLAEALAAALAAAAAPRREPAQERQPAPQAGPSLDDVAARLDAVAAALSALEARLAAQPPQSPRPPDPAPAPLAEVPLAPARPPEPPRLAEPAPSANQPALPFAEPAEAAPPRPIGWEDVVRALDFPRDDHDAAGFAALQSAVRDPEIAKLLQAAEDVLSMLAADGAHMEDMRPVHASLEAWRAYADGARGAAAATIGGVRDEAALERIGARLKRDAIFRDACLVFARRWGAFTARVFRELGDDPLMLRIADSRSGRAFMLVARAMGAFD